jgi:hypothetical protein
MLTQAKIEPKAVTEGIGATRAKREERFDRNEAIEIAGRTDIEARRCRLQLPDRKRSVAGGRKPQVFDSSSFCQG